MPIQSTILKTEAARIKAAVEATMIKLLPKFPNLSNIEILSQLLSEMGFGSAVKTPTKSYVVSVAKGKTSRNAPSGTFKKGLRNSEAVLAFAKTERAFSSKEAQDAFKASPEKMAGSLASLTRQGLLRKLEAAAEDGSTAWRYVGKRRN